MNDGLGLWLRRTRETHQVTLEAAEKALRIRRRYLQALEMGDFTALPGEIQARGFLRNYARFLGLPVEEALARYDAELQGRPVQPRSRVVTEEAKNRVAERPSVFSPPPTDSSEDAVAPRVGVSSGLLQILILAILFFVALAVGSFIWLQVASNKPSESVPVATVEKTVIPTQALETPSALPAFLPAADGTVSVRLAPREHAWVSISADERIVFQGVADPQQVLEASAREILIVATGNGGAFQLYLNGTDWGLLGGQGAVVRRAWTPAGEVSLEGQ